MFFSKNMYATISMGFCISIILGGFLFFLLPVTLENSLTFTDSCFLSTSALSVTGLSSVSLTSLSLCGKVLLMILTFIGGIGLATLLISIAVYFYRSRIDLVAAATKIFDTIDFEELHGIIRSIIYGSLFILSLGTLLFCMIRNYYDIEVPLFDLFFMTINTFSNAGFMPYSEASEILYRTSGGMILSTLLMLVGSLGFLCMYEGYMWVKSRKAREPYFFSLTIRVGCSIYFYTLLFAASLFFLLIRNFSFRGAVESIFYAVSMRSCGMFFNYLFFISPFLIFFILLYSFIGTLPLSTGSGLKTSILAIILASIKSIMYNQDVVTLKQKSMPFVVVIKAFVYCLYTICVISLLILALRITVSPAEYLLVEIVIDAVGVFTNSGITCFARTLPSGY
jgi:Trk-type K+ transport system membrane component